VQSDHPTEHLATDLLAASLLVIQNAVGGGEHDDTEQAGGQEAPDPVLNIRVGEVVAGADDAALVDAPVDRGLHTFPFPLN
jgi:hypothetical protein